jgi:methylmalonyl-CoA/ethylmalonyl-CoA epimerase
MNEKFVFHHVGVAVPDLEKARAFYSEAMGFQLAAGPFDDPIQKVTLCFVGSPAPGRAPTELICPLDTISPVNRYLAKGIGAYHVCFEVEGVAETLRELWGKGCVIVSEPVPAVAFGGRQIAWCFTPTKQLIELLERQAPPAG